MNTHDRFRVAGFFFLALIILFVLAILSYL